MTENQFKNELFKIDNINSFDTWDNHFKIDKIELDKLEYHPPIKRIIKLFDEGKAKIKYNHFPKEIVNINNIRIKFNSYNIIPKIIGKINTEFVYTDKYIITNLILFKSELGNFIYNNQNNFLFILVTSGNINFNDNEFIVQSIGDVIVQHKLIKDYEDYNKKCINYERLLKLQNLYE